MTTAEIIPRATKNIEQITFFELNLLAFCLILIERELLFIVSGFFTLHKHFSNINLTIISHMIAVNKGTTVASI